MKKLFSILISLSMVFGLCACGDNYSAAGSIDYEGTKIVLSDKGITVDGEDISRQSGDAVYAANDIVYYESGHDFTYGEGEKSDEHSAKEAEAHTVVHITQPGQYVLSGSLSKGQIAVDLGEDAKDDPDAVVTLVLNCVDISCSVAPAVIFYSVYECAEGEPSAEADTSAAGAKVIIADLSQNSVTGSHVARIYKPGTVELSEDGSEVLDAKKLHKYDGAFYSKMSMDISGGKEGSGSLSIFADNEGLDSEMHLTINSGHIFIESGNDGINTNEDGVSVTTINGGRLHILVNGATGEGDGIDSNGWLVINGGEVWAQACAFSGDAGIDSDMGIHINGGEVWATGNMLDRISESRQNYAVFTFSEPQMGGSYVLSGQQSLRSPGPIENTFSYLIVSSPELKSGEYSLSSTLGDVESRYEGTASAGMGGFDGAPGGMTPPGGMEIPEGGMTPPEGMDMPEGGMTPPEGMEIPDGGMTPPGGMEIPEGGMTPPGGMEMPGMGHGSRGQQGAFAEGEYSDIFNIKDGENYFSGVREVK